MFASKHPKENPSTVISQFMKEFNRSLSLIADKNLHLQNFTAKIRQISKSQEVYIFLADIDTGKLKIQYPEEQRRISFSASDHLIHWLSVNEKYLLISQNRNIFDWFLPHEQDYIGELKVELIYPLKMMNRMSGMIFLGKKENGDKFTEEEIDLLSLLFDQASYAIEYSSLYEIQNKRIKKMYRTDRLATLGELAAGAAHEIRNPLTTIRSTIQYLSKDFSDNSEKKAMINELILEVERINRILQGLLSFAKPAVLNQADISIQSLIEQTLTLANTSLRKANIEVEFEYFSQDTIIRADSEQLKQVFLNIILNAIDAMQNNPPDRKRELIISIEPSPSPIPEQRKWLISFEDSGKGIEPEKMEDIFNPFYTTKTNGTGLGLAICYGIITRHKGDILVKSTLEKGSCFTIKLPELL